MTEYNENEAPQETTADTDFKTEAEYKAEAVAEVPEQTNALSMTAGLAAPPSPTLDTEDGGSDWDAEGFTPPTLEEMPTEGPGSPGFDIYAPENAQYLNPEPSNEDETVPEPTEVEDFDDEDVKTALESETSDGPGEVDVNELPESDVPAGTELAEDYPDLEPRGEDLEEKA